MKKTPKIPMFSKKETNKNEEASLKHSPRPSKRDSKEVTDLGMTDPKSPRQKIEDRPPKGVIVIHDDQVHDPIEILSQETEALSLESVDAIVEMPLVIDNVAPPRNEVIEIDDDDVSDTIVQPPQVISLQSVGTVVETPIGNELVQKEVEKKVLEKEMKDEMLSTESLYKNCKDWREVWMSLEKLQNYHGRYKRLNFTIESNEYVEIISKLKIHLKTLNVNTRSLESWIIPKFDKGWFPLALDAQTELKLEDLLFFIDKFELKIIQNSGLFEFQSDCTGEQLFKQSTEFAKMIKDPTVYTIFEMVPIRDGSNKTKLVAYYPGYTSLFPRRSHEHTRLIIDPSKAPKTPYYRKYSSLNALKKTIVMPLAFHEDHDHILRLEWFLSYAFETVHFMRCVLLSQYPTFQFLCPVGLNLIPGGHSSKNTIVVKKWELADLIRIGFTCVDDDSVSGAILQNIKGSNFTGLHLDQIGAIYAEWRAPQRNYLRYLLDGREYTDKFHLETLLAVIDIRVDPDYHAKELLRYFLSYVQNHYNDSDFFKVFDDLELQQELLSVFKTLTSKEGKEKYNQVGSREFKDEVEHACKKLKGSIGKAMKNVSSVLSSKGNNTAKFSATFLHQYYNVKAGKRARCQFDAIDRILLHLQKLDVKGSTEFKNDEFLSVGRWTPKLSPFETSQLEKLAREYLLVLKERGVGFDESSSGENLKMSEFWHCLASDWNANTKNDFRFNPRPQLGLAGSIRVIVHEWKKRGLIVDGLMDISKE